MQTRWMTSLMTLGWLLGLFHCGLSALATPGDVDSDGVVTTKDRQGIIDHLLGLSVLDGEAFTHADVNGDGMVDVADIVSSARR